MNLPATIQTIERLKQELDALRPLKKEDEERLWKKFRLEWNYNSNHIEGNTLSYGETELLLFFGKTTGDHTLREYEEMKAHDIAVAWLKEVANEEDDRMSEMFIRQLNEIILKEPYWKVVETPDGNQTRKEIIPGQYKTSPNSVLLASGEMFHYASPEETPAKMGDLVQWYREAVGNDKLHPVQIAAELHYKFVLIHPFDDGNGRVARLLMNYALMRAGYPPIIIPTKDKKAYLDALNKVDTKVDVLAFAEYIAKQLVWSLELNVKAAKGEDIEEEDDLDKEFEVWERATKLTPQVMKVSLGLIQNLFKDTIEDFFSDFVSTHENFFGKFEKVYISFEVDNAKFNDLESVRSSLFYDSTLAIPPKEFESLTGKKVTEMVLLESSISKISAQVFLSNYQFAPNERVFGVSSVMMINFSEYEYEIIYNGQTLVRRAYRKFLTQDEAAKFIKLARKQTLNYIKRQSGLDT